MTRPFIALVGIWVYAEPLRLAVFVGAGINFVDIRGERRRAAA